MSELFTRDGHLLDLTIDRLLADDLTADERARVDTHLTDCEPCRDRVEASEPVLSAVPAWRPPTSGPSEAAIGPPAREAEVVPLWTRRWVPGVVAVMAIAAAALIVVKTSGSGAGPGSGGGPGEFRAKGHGDDLVFEVWRDANGHAEQLADGATVHAGDKLAFRVASASDGWLLVAGVDQSGVPYAGWPQGEPVQAGQVRASGEPAELPAAIQLDAAPGEERLVAVRCPDRFGLDDVRPALAAASVASLPSGCVAQSMTFPKASSP